mgnify:CR=1 FL=1
MQYDEDMWRCGDPQYFGGDGPEEEVDLTADGRPLFWRAPFPGAPFRSNDFDGDGAPLPVCTPSIDGAGAVGQLNTVFLLAAALAAVQLARQ